MRKLLIQKKIKKTETQQIIERLHKILRPFLLRRIKSEVEKAIPPKTETKIFVKMAKKQREWYKIVLEKDLEALNSATGQKTRLLNTVMQLRKVCAHPYLFTGAEPGPPYIEGEHLIEACGKLIVLDKLLKRLKEKGSRVLVFSQMTRVLDILEDYMMYRKWKYCRIDGSTAHTDREEQIEAFNAPDSEYFLFLLSTRAGGLGINLASANVVILYDSDWNPQVDLQAQDRVHRIGQTKPVSIYRLITEGAIEEKIVERAEVKLRLDALVIQQGRLVEQNKALTREELIAMIRFGAKSIFEAKEGADITEEDIDTILAHGEERTKELNQKLKENENSLMNWSLDDGTSRVGLYTFEGVDYSGRGNISRSKRVRDEPATYNDVEYYRKVLSRNPRNNKGSKQPRPPKQPNIQHWQFFPNRLKEIFQKETKAWENKLDYIQKKRKSVSCKKSTR